MSDVKCCLSECPSVYATSEAPTCGLYFVLYLYTYDWSSLSVVKDR